MRRSGAPGPFASPSLNSSMALSLPISSGGILPAVGLKGFCTCVIPRIAMEASFAFRRFGKGVVVRKGFARPFISLYIELYCFISIYITLYRIISIYTELYRDRAKAPRGGALRLARVPQRWWSSKTCFMNRWFSIRKNTLKSMSIFSRTSCCERSRSKRSWILPMRYSTVLR